MKNKINEQKIYFIYIISDMKGIGEQYYVGTALV